jgi:hypothetical protein
MIIRFEKMAWIFNFLEGSKAPFFSLARGGNVVYTSLKCVAYKNGRTN